MWLFFIRQNSTKFFLIFVYYIVSFGQSQRTCGCLFLYFFLSIVTVRLFEFELKNSNSEERTLRNYKDSDYALNKYSEGIVYKFTDVTIEVTLKDYLRDNPDKTEADFMELKTLSDEIYYQQDRQEQRTSRLNVSINGLEETEKVATPSVDTLLLQKEEEENVLEAAYQLLHSGKLTPIQKRRFIQHYFQGLSIREIARREGVHQRAVWDSLRWAEKKLKKFYKR